MVAGIIIAINSVFFHKQMFDRLVNNDLPVLSDDIMVKIDDKIMELSRGIQLSAKSPLLQTWVHEGEPNERLDEIYNLLENIITTYDTLGANFVSAQTGQYTDLLNGKRDWSYHVSEDKDSWFTGFRDSNVSLNIVVYVGDPVWGTKAFINRRVEVDNKFAGLLSCSIDIEEFANELSKMSIGSKGRTFLVDENGFIRLHEDTGLLNKPLTEVYTVYKPLEQAIRNNDRYQTSYADGNDVRYVISTKIPVLNWYLITEASETEFMSNVRRFTMLSIGISLVLALICSILGIYVIRNMVRPLRKTAAYATAVSKGDLSGTLEVERKDEIGEVAKALRNMVEALQKQIKDAESYGLQMKEQMERAEHARREGESLRQKTDAMLEISQRGAAETAEISNTLNVVYARLNEANIRVTNGAQKQYEHMQHTTEAINFMMDSFSKIMSTTDIAVQRMENSAHRAIEGEHKVKDVILANEAVNTLASKMDQSMNELNVQTESITRIIDTITDIADQTNLLALNAAIEAARAGEAGKGFSVVANEVRKLAEKTMAATDEVSESIKQVQCATMDNINAMQEVYKAVQHATELAETSGNAMHSIVELSDENSGFIKNIAQTVAVLVESSDSMKKSLEDVNGIAQDTMNNMQDTSLIVDELSEQTVRLDNLIHELKQNKH